MCLAASVLAGQSQTKSRAADLASMVDAERAFAAAAKAAGIKAAFLEYLDDDAITLLPAPGRAKDVWRGRPDPPDPLKAKLTWEPRTGTVSSSGDLGWLTGPYVFMPEAGAQASYGCYFSVWMRSPGKPWRVALDQGIDTPEPCAFKETGFREAKTARWKGAGDAPDVARRKLLGRDGEVSNGATNDAGPTIIANVLDANGRVYRPGRQILVGAVAARVYLVTEQPAISTTPIEAVVSGAQDLGFTYGTVDTGDAPAKHAYYLRVWSRQPSGSWAIVADILTRAQ
jgi:ketosteroid isomerase-like protein